MPFLNLANHYGKPKWEGIAIAEVERFVKTASAQELLVALKSDYANGRNASRSGAQLLVKVLQFYAGRVEPSIAARARPYYANKIADILRYVLVKCANNKPELVTLLLKSKVTSTSSFCYLASALRTSIEFRDHVLVSKLLALFDEMFRAHDFNRVIATALGEGAYEGISFILPKGLDYLVESLRTQPRSEQEALSYKALVRLLRNICKRCTDQRQWRKIKNIMFEHLLTAMCTDKCHVEMVAPLFFDFLAKTSVSQLSNEELRLILSLKKKCQSQLQDYLKKLYERQDILDFEQFTAKTVGLGALIDHRIDGFIARLKSKQSPERNWVELRLKNHAKAELDNASIIVNKDEESVDGGDQLVIGVPPNKLYHLTAQLLQPVTYSAEEMAAHVEKLRKYVASTDAVALRAEANAIKQDGFRSNTSAVSCLSVSIYKALREGDEILAREILACFNKLANKCMTQALVPGLTAQQKDGEWSKTNALYLMIASLVSAYEKRLPNMVCLLSDTLKNILNEPRTVDFLSATAQVDERFGGNGLRQVFALLLREVSHPSCHKDMFDALIQVVEQMIKSASRAQLKALMYQKQMSGPFAEKNAVYLLCEMVAAISEMPADRREKVLGLLSGIMQILEKDVARAKAREVHYTIIAFLINANEKRSVQSACKLTDMIMETLDHPNAITALLEIFEEETADGLNSIWLIFAFLHGEILGMRCDATIFDALLQVIEKIIGAASSQQLVKLLYHGPKTGEIAGAHAMMQFYNTIARIDEVPKDKQEKLLELFFYVLQKLDTAELTDSQKQPLLELKDNKIVKAALKKYIEEKVVQGKSSVLSDSNMLGALISHHRFFLGRVAGMFGYPTGARLYAAQQGREVNKLFVSDAAYQQQTKDTMLEYDEIPSPIKVSEKPAPSYEQESLQARLASAIAVAKARIRKKTGFYQQSKLTVLEQAEKYLNGEIDAKILEDVIVRNPCYKFSVKGPSNTEKLIAEVKSEVLAKQEVVVAIPADELVKQESKSEEKAVVFGVPVARPSTQACQVGVFSSLRRARAKVFDHETMIFIDLLKKEVAALKTQCQSDDHMAKYKVIVSQLASLQSSDSDLTGTLVSINTEIRGLRWLIESSVTAVSADSEVEHEPVRNVAAFACS